MTTEKPSMWDRTFPVLNHKRDNLKLSAGLAPLFRKT